MEYHQVIAASSSESENPHIVNHLHSSAVSNLICSHTKSTFKSVAKENIKPPSQAQGKLLKDYISELPAEIVVDILSQLKTKEAISTSILSRGWRYKWTTIYNLDFDGTKILDDADAERKIKCLKVERPIFISRVNEVLGRHQGQTIDQLTIVFTLDDTSCSDIDGWVSFAVRKRVQRLKLDLRRRHYTQNHYSLSNSLEISSCRSLTSLHLEAVDITGEMLELFLHNCLNLERVFVGNSRTLINLNIEDDDDSTTPLKLKWLELYCCHKIEWLNVSAPNLVSFKYLGPIIAMPFKDVPNLLDISINGLYGCYINSHLFELSSYLSQLEKLSLGASVFESHMNIEGRFPVFPKLRQLTLMVGTPGFKGIIDYASLIKACPSLYYYSFESLCPFTYPARRKPFRREASVHNMIRVVEFIGFHSNVFEVEMAEYLIENAVMLEKITFDAVSPALKGKWREFDFPPSETQISARGCARELGKRLRPGVELVIL